MEKQEIKISVAEGVNTLEIRQGDAAPILARRGYSLTGLAIGAVQEYLQKEGVCPEKIQHSYAEYSYEGLYLSLKLSDRFEEPDLIEGVLKLHPELEKWKINKDKAYDNMSLSNFIKMNRHFFENKDVAMALVSELQNFRVKVETEAEKSDDKRGNYKELIAQKIAESNLPQSFILNLPVFVGQKTQKVAVEIEVNAKTFECSLVSPDLKEIIDIETRGIIDAELAAIRTLQPQLRIFQK